MRKGTCDDIIFEMASIREIEEEIKNDFEKGAAKCLEDIIIALREKVYNDNREGTRDMKDTVKFSNENIENFDVFFREIMIALLYKGYIMKEENKKIDDECFIEVYVHHGKRGSEKYFKNIKKNTGNGTYAEIPTHAEFVGMNKFKEKDNSIINYKIYDCTETIRKTLVSNARNNRNVREAILTYDIPNEGDKPLEYYCENDDILDSIVKTLKDGGYECKTEVRTGLSSKFSERLNGTLTEGYHYRDIIVEW